MFSMSDLSIALQSTEKSYTFPLKDTSLTSIASDISGTFPRQNWVGKLIYFYGLSTYIFISC